MRKLLHGVAISLLLTSVAAVGAAGPAAAVSIPTANGASCIEVPVDARCEIWSSNTSGVATYAGPVVATADRVFAITNGSSGGDFGLVAYAADDGSLLWAKTYGWPGSDFPVDIAYADGRVFVTGKAASVDGQVGDLGTIAVNAQTGAELWRQRYGTPGDYDESAAGIAVDPDGSRVYVTATVQPHRGSDDRDIATLAYDAVTGALLWQEVFAGPEELFEGSVAIGVTTGRVFVAGTTTVEPSFKVYRERITVLAYATDPDAETRRLWAVSFGENGRDVSAADLQISEQAGALVVAGTSRDTAADTSRYVALSFDPDDGLLRWAKEYSGEEGSASEAVALAADGERAYVTGTTSPYPFNQEGTISEGSDIATVAFELSTGKQLWAALEGAPGPFTDDPVGVVLTQDGVAITGDASLSGTSYTVGYRATGEREWTAQFGLADAYNRPDQVELYFPLGIASSPNGRRVFVSGYYSPLYPNYHTPGGPPCCVPNRTLAYDTT